MESKRLRIDPLNLDFQSEREIDPDKVLEYVHVMRQRKAISPVTVYFDGKTYRLFDGFHRVRAARDLQRKTINAEVVQGTPADMHGHWLKGLEAIKEYAREWMKNNIGTRKGKLS
jgi:ParB-like chromosome segregation protein Spo0J